MKQNVTTAIILSRIDYGEADRILTLLTPDYGKLRVLAKGVRRIKSKMAGGIELFSVSNISFVQGRGDFGTLTSTRLIKHYGNIVTDLDRTTLGYDLIKKLNKVTEDRLEIDYFDLLKQAFEALNTFTIAQTIIKFWFMAQLLRLGGHTPNLQTDARGQQLKPGTRYRFNVESMCFDAVQHGPFGTDHIKFLRLTFSGHQVEALSKIQGSANLAADCDQITDLMLARNT